MTAPPASTRPVVAFDLDGTLVDTAPDLLDALDLVLAPHNIPPVNRDEARNMIGGGARLLIVRALKSEGVALPDAEVEAMTKRFIAHYADNIAVGSRPFPGLLKALDRLSAKGVSLAVCTNKLEHLARLLLDALDLTERFSVITGADTYPRSKPDPLPLVSTIAAAGGSAAQAIMVGDSITDVLTARATGVPVVAVSFGYTETPAAELGADALIHHFDELERAVDALLARPAA
ncbi:phosphoglycolate phosphatase [Xanthobacter versatilis]|uniref:phosphoglycolate phosphatase n=1 Tax=Xanthobacter autotrophicus (strain ATCC BAA-1158 / Py2) TaxID=78245 RepID=UPI00372BEA67